MGMHLPPGRDRSALQAELDRAREQIAALRLKLAEHVRGERRARHRACHDELTALPNRRYFRERLGEALAASDSRQRPLAVLYLDLDGFKPINDIHGHRAGDALLRAVGARLAQTVRAEDLVGRLGGDEFACLLWQRKGRPGLGELAQRIVEAVARPLLLGDVALSVRPSIGIALCDGPDDADALLHRADLAMYRAKRQRSGYAFFEAAERAASSAAAAASGP